MVLEATGLEESEADWESAEVKSEALVVLAVLAVEMAGQEAAVPAVPVEAVVREGTLAAAAAQAAPKEPKEFLMAPRQRQATMNPVPGLFSQGHGEEISEDGGWKNRIRAIPKTSGPESMGLFTALTMKDTWWKAGFSSATDGTI